MSRLKEGGGGRVCVWGSDSPAHCRGQEGQKPPLSVPTFQRPKGFYRPADSNAGTIITSLSLIHI